MDTLSYPFDVDYLLRKKKSIKRELLLQGQGSLEKKIAILGGSTTDEVKNMLELFLLNNGINPLFYESEYGQYWQDVMFAPEQLRKFAPDIFYIHTTCRNITKWPEPKDDLEQVNAKLEYEYEKLKSMWDRIKECYGCSIIQNNFERPIYRILGNSDTVDFHGRTNFVFNLNQKIYEYARCHEGFFVNDIDYLSACYGLQQWQDPFYWHMYKYALCVRAIPELAYSVANIIKSIYGKNKKALVIDLDNTLWGGIVGDDGVEGIAIGQEMPMGQAYAEFQEYLHECENMGVMLAVCSKNEVENALAGLNHPDGILRPNDFLVIKANWEQKDKNVREIADELNIGIDSLVFIDDNPAERMIVSKQIPEVEALDIGNVQNYIQRIDRAGFFESVGLSSDDLARNEMYRANTQRVSQQAEYTTYKDYLKSLEMIAIIRNFEPIYMQRIAQLTNKSNQFNLTTKRYTIEDLEHVACSPNHICLYGKLEDKFGDNGVVSVIIGEIADTVLHIRLWLMSCRVLRRDMECAMLDALVGECRKCNITAVKGYYYPTAKNGMVKELYSSLGFKKTCEDDEGNTVWSCDMGSIGNNNTVIKVIK